MRKEEGEGVEISGKVRPKKVGRPVFLVMGKNRAGGKRERELLGEEVVYGVACPVVGGGNLERGKRRLQVPGVTSMAGGQGPHPAFSSITSNQGRTHTYSV